MNRKLIIGCALYSEVEKIDSFCKSLSKVRDDETDIALLIDNKASVEYLNYLNQYKIFPVSVNSFSRYIPDRFTKYRFSRKFSFFSKHLPFLFSLLPSKFKKQLIFSSNKFFNHVALSRYAYYYEVLEKNPQYEKILFTDVRDVIFQRNPFSFEWKEDLYFFFEDYKNTLETQNWIWMNGLYGEKIFEKMGKNQVICSGTTFGTREALMNYCFKMCEEQLKHIYKIAGFDGYDQGVHNYLIYSNTFNDFKIWKNFIGPVLTMHGMDSNELVLGTDLKLRDLSNNIIPVLHQYDRHPEITEKLLNQIRS